MRIAQVAPLTEAVPPKLYGGTERVVSWLTEELVRQGHQVTLFASGDSTTTAKLVPFVPQGLRLAGVRDPVASHVAMLKHVRTRADEFDIIHFHVDLLQHALFRDRSFKCVTTLHGRLDLPEYGPVFQDFPEMPLVSISEGQRAPVPPTVNWLATVYHGLPSTLCPYHADGGDYLAFLGRISPEKRPDRAIEIAKRAGIPLKIAAKVDLADRNYYEEAIAPLIEGDLVQFVGEIDDSAKAAFLGHARALLFPIDWPEPFGLVMIEAMSTGTPVIAFRTGSVPEIIADGVSGLIVESVEEAVEAARRVHQMSRIGVRRHFEHRFTATRMAGDYINAYEALLARRGARRSSLVAA